MTYPLFLQSQSGDEAYNDNGLVPRTIRLLKDKFPDIVSNMFLIQCAIFFVALQLLLFAANNMPDLGCLHGCCIGPLFI